MRMRLEGMKALEAGIRNHLNNLGDAYSRGAQQAGQDLLEYSRPLAPLDTGALQASGIQMAQGSGWKTVVWVGFGAEVSGFERVPKEYAVYQHEMSTYARHWLQMSADDLGPLMSNTIAREMRTV